MSVIERETEKKNPIRRCQKRDAGAIGMQIMQQWRQTVIVLDAHGRIARMCSPSEIAGQWIRALCPGAAIISILPVEEQTRFATFFNCCRNSSDPQDCTIGIPDATLPCNRQFLQLSLAKVNDEVWMLVRDITAEQKLHSEICHARNAREQLKTLTERETSVVQMLVNGASNKMMARELKISIKTIEKHRGSAMKKLRARCITDAVRIWLTANAPAIQT
ncbi:MAG: hypothetical protein KDA91_04830 [Planctomycetaceae bacterium]|nr:hypothetical protein [Planctomycetaceae bacterium]